MPALRVILGDQLSHAIAALNGIDAARDVVLMAEVAEEAAYVPHHAQKLVFIFSAMRHFADELRAKGLKVDYIRLDDPENTGSLTGEVTRALERHGADTLITTEPGEWRVRRMMEDSWPGVIIREDTRFFASRARFARWAGDRKSFRMEFFYREMRRETGLLMEPDGTPAGGEWNYDAENRKAPPKSLRPPPAPRIAPDAVTAEVIGMVRRRFPKQFGSLDNFGWAVTRADAENIFAHFLRHGLPLFGDYQDAMVTGEPFLWHAVISPYLNAGLLDPRAVCAAAEAEWRQGRAPLNAVEGFIRQILGWREYVRGIYWHLMPGYAATNALNATRPLPDFYWTGETEMNCLRQAISDTRAHAYAHHIQRLMVTGNFALLAGLDPAAVNEWYLAVYADAYEWVELPNTHGMVLHADGGVMASKPYAASGAYINRMSDYCKGCAYDVKQKRGPKACPLNYLYWDFLIRNEAALRKNPRMAMPYRTLAKMSAADRAAITADAGSFLTSAAPPSPRR